LTDLEHPDDPQDSAKLKAVLLLVAAMAFVVAPLISQPFTGFNPAQLPIPVDDPPIQPAGWAFSIWGVIYLWLLGSAGYGLIRRDTAPDWDRGRWGAFVSLAIGASWIAVALSTPVMATILIWLMLGGALWALARAPARDRGGTRCPWAFTPDGSPPPPASRRAPSPWAMAGAAPKRSAGSCSAWRSRSRFC
jgi:hypothetical protein